MTVNGTQKTLLVGAIKSAVWGATSIVLSLNIIDPKDFSLLTVGGLKRLGLTVLISIVIAEARYWNQWAKSGNSVVRVSVLLSVLLLAMTASAQTSANAPAKGPEPNEGDHLQVSTTYTIDGDKGQAIVAVLSIPISDRFSILAVNSVAPKVGLNGITLHSLELEYARTLADVMKARSAQFNPNRFAFAVSGGAGTARNAQGEGNASLALTIGGRFTVRLKDNISMDLVNVRYWRSRIATFFGQAGGETQLASGFRFHF